MGIPLEKHPIHRVLEGDYCSGCGACAVVADGEMVINQYGQYVPDANRFDLRADVSEKVEAACPFLKPALNEDVLAGERFAGHAQKDDRIGYHHRIFAGHVVEGDFRQQATSGGMGTWLGVELLRKGEIDGVIHVKAAERAGVEDPFFTYQISRSEAQIREGAKTRYHVVELSKVMAEVKRTPGRYLFIGVPCLAKAVRRLQKLDPVIAERVPYVAALICGHFKSVHWTLSLAWGGGIHPTDVGAFQYRTKDPDLSARAYVFRAQSASKPDKLRVQKDSSQVTGGKWNTCAMMLNACDYCDDVVGETADVTIGDAWLPKYTKDYMGTNLLVVRHPKLSEMLESASEQGRVWIEPVDLEDAAASQAGGLRHRRAGLSYRLGVKESKGEWAPEKRVPADVHAVSEHRQKIYNARSEYAAVSRVAFREALDGDDYAHYQNAMSAFEKRFVYLEIGTTPIRKVLLMIFGESSLRRLMNFRRTLPQRIKRMLGRA